MDELALNAMVDPAPEPQADAKPDRGSEVGAERCQRCGGDNVSWHAPPEAPTEATQTGGDVR